MVCIPVPGILFVFDMFCSFFDDFDFDSSCFSCRRLGRLGRVRCHCCAGRRRRCRLLVVDSQTCSGCLFPFILIIILVIFVRVPFSARLACSDSVQSDCGGLRKRKISAKRKFARTTFFIDVFKPKTLCRSLRDRIFQDFFFGC